MALRKPAGQVAETPGGFEEAGGTVVAERPVVDTSGANPSAPQAAASVASTAIAKAAATSLVKSAKIETVFADLQDVIPAVDFGVLQKLVGATGQFQDSDKKFLGDTLQFTLLSWNNTYVVSPGDDSDEAKEAVGYSRDGKTLNETGEDIHAYLATLKAGDYDKASIKHYVELIGVLEGAFKGGNPVACDHIGNMVQIQLSPQSRKSFEGYRLQRTVKVRMGKVAAEGAENLVLRAEGKTANGKSFTVITTNDK